VLGMILVGTLLEMLGVGLVIPLVVLLMQEDIVQQYPLLQPAFDWLGRPDRATLVCAGLLVFLGVYLVKTLFLSLLAWRQGRFVFAVRTRMAERLFGVYLHQPYSFHLQRHSAQLIRNITDETDLFVGRVMLPALLCLAEGMAALGLVSLMLVVEPLGTLCIVGLFALVIAGFYTVSDKYLRRWGALRQHHAGQSLQHLTQGLEGIKATKLGGHETEFLARYVTHLAPLASAQSKQAVLIHIPRLGLEVLAVSALTILVLSIVLQGRELGVVLPILGLSAAVTFRLTPSVNRIINALQNLSYGRSAIDRLTAELALEASGPVGAADEKVTPFAGAVVVHQLCYTYPNAAAPVLKRVSMEIKQGEAVGIVGESGAGKSTLLDILLGLLRPQEGGITIDGAAMQEDPRNWQRQIGYVPQSIFLTDDSLRRNVAFGVADADIDDDAVLDAIGAAQLGAFIADLPDGVDTFVGERGVRLSGGQRQRIGIARALYHNPTVLVLDEATSALDLATEREVMQAVTALHGRKTLIIVTHRLSTIEYCQRLYRLHDGQIVQLDPSDAAYAAVNR